MNRGCAGPKGSYTPVKGSKFRSWQNSVSPDLLRFLQSQPTRKGMSTALVTKIQMS